MADRVPARLTAAQGRRFAFTVGAAFLVFGGIAWWRQHPTAATVLASLGALLAVAGTVAPTALGPVERAWMGLAHAISKVTTPVFMGVIYFVVITPIALLMGAFGKRPLTVRPATTYWKPRPAGARRGDLTRQF